jgi:hypothetical protein
VAVDVVESGAFEAQPFTARQRPAPCGVSVGHPERRDGVDEVGFDPARER